MNYNVTASYKEEFMEAVKLANKELHTYINNYITIQDFEYSDTIGFGGDNSLKIDLIAENIFIKHLGKFGNIFSEECGLKTTNKEFTIVIDPLDGSNNFYSDLPYYGTSIALQKDNKTIAGFVTNLVTGVIQYRAFDSEIKYYSIVKNKNFFPFYQKNPKISIFERAYQYPNICKKLYKSGFKYRSLGSVAISLSDARNYNFVLYAGKIREFDVAASLYLCRDLFIFRTNNFLLISPNEKVFELVKEFIKEV